MSDDSDYGLTVTEAAKEIGCHPQTLRKALREAEDSGEPIAGKTQGRYGLEWRIPEKSIESLRGEFGAESTDAESSLSQAHSILSELRDGLNELTQGQKALRPSAEEVAERAERDRRIEAALAGNAERVEELAKESGELRAKLAQAEGERDKSRQRAAKLHQQLKTERGRSWWQKLQGK